MPPQHTVEAELMLCMRRSCAGRLGAGGQRRERMLSGVHSTFMTPGGREGVLGASCAERR
ncbi:hypothetical protein B1729_07890 [Microbacterium sp. B35-04]|nr:hypothetical protein B1729_07890 [Microbacterium sp. B35-04]